MGISYGIGRWNFSSPVVGPDGTIYVGSHDYKLYAINPNGTKKWEYLTGGIVNSSPAIGNDGTIHVGSFDKNLYALDADGKKKWNFFMDDVVHSSPVIGNGVVYVGAGNNLFAIYCSSTRLANSPWPMFHRDLKHTGRIPPGITPTVSLLLN